MLTQIQNDLFDVGADLCTPVAPDPKWPPLRVTEAQVERLEGWCDEYNAGLAKLYAAPSSKARLATPQPRAATLTRPTSTPSIIW